MKKYQFLLTFCLLLILPVLLPAQTAAEIEELLNTKAVSYEQAARFLLEAADLSAPRTPPEAFQYAAERRWLPKKAVAGGEASLQGVSLLVMRSFNLKGGLFYSIFKNPHYAYRELVYQDVIQGRSDPQMAVSGETLLFIVNRVISRQGNDVDYDLDGKYQPLVSGYYDLHDEVAAFNISLGIRGAGEVYTQGYGFERPIADNGTPEGMARNRRVEITKLENQ